MNIKNIWNHHLVITIPKTNSSPPENLTVKDEFPFGKAPLQVRTVSFRDDQKYCDWSLKTHASQLSITVSFIYFLG